jgi:hypothetical protein
MFSPAKWPGKEIFGGAVWFGGDAETVRAPASS